MSGAFLLGGALLNSQTRRWDWYDENGVCLLANDRTHPIRCIPDAQAVPPVRAVMRKPTEVALDTVFVQRKHNGPGRDDKDLADPAIGEKKGTYERSLLALVKGLLGGAQNPHAKTQPLRATPTRCSTTCSTAVRLPAMVTSE